MLSAGITWKSLQLTLSNDSSLPLRSSPCYPPALQGSSYSGPSGNLLLEGGSTTVELRCEDAACEGSAFLTYFLGDFQATLVIWLCIKPEAGSDIKFGIFDKDQKLDHDVLRKVAQEEIKLETIGFWKDLLWKFKGEKGRMDEISMVVDITSTDRQLEAQLRIREPNKPSVDVLRPIKALYNPAATIESGTKAIDRVHEDMAISSLISGGVKEFFKDTTYEKILGEGYKVHAPSSWEFIRGVLWNDDPACDFFHDFKLSNGYFQTDTPWASNFNKPGTITYRSHHGDLQFLHAMASTTGEKPEETQRKIMLWIEVMYRLSVGDGIREADRIDSTGLREFFNNTTKPKGSQAFRDLLVGSTPSTVGIDIKRRALGSCLHVIQDSYMVGHCQRELDNPGDMIDVEYTNYWKYDEWHPTKEKIYIKGFPQDKPGRFSSIKAFHCYKGQDEGRHGYYDTTPNAEEFDPADPKSFYCLVGAADALPRCASLARAWVNRWPWDSEVSPNKVVIKMMQEIFHLAPDATSSDVEVDKHLWEYNKSTDA